MVSETTVDGNTNVFVKNMDYKPKVFVNEMAKKLAEIVNGMV